MRHYYYTDFDLTIVFMIFCVLVFIVVCLMLGLFAMVKNKRSYELLRTANSRKATDDSQDLQKMIVTRIIIFIWGLGAVGAAFMAFIKIILPLMYRKDLFFHFRF